MMTHDMKHLYIFVNGWIFGKENEVGKEVVGGFVGVRREGCG
jgi:hypothetical protein